MEEGGGFEPPESYPSMVFETIPFGRSGTLPCEKGYRCEWPCPLGELGQLIRFVWLED